MKHWGIAVLAAVFFGCRLTAVGDVFGDFEYTSDGESITITHYTGAGGDVVIPDTIEGLPVTVIGQGAFYSDSGLLSVIIPESVIMIGRRAFSGCSNLTSVAMSDSVTSIGDEAFWGCSTLGSLEIPGSVTHIGYSAFLNCGSLVSLHVAEENPAYSDLDGVLFNKEQTTLIQYPGGKSGDYTIPGSVSTVEESAFTYCDNLTGLVVPESVTKVGWHQSPFHSNLTILIIPYTHNTLGILASLDTTVFEYTSDDSGISIRGYSSRGNEAMIPDTILGLPVTTVGKGAFASQLTMTRVVLPSSLTTISNEAFADCLFLTEITIPDNVKTIGDRAFEHCYSLTNVTIGNGVHSIGEWAFASCPNLTRMDIPASVVFIGNGAFSGCRRLMEIKVEAENAFYSDLNGVLFNKDQTMLIQAPGRWSGGYTLPDGVTVIGDWAFIECAGLTSLIIPFTVIRIGGRAFSGCSALASVYFAGDAPDYGASDFLGSDNVTVYYLRGTTGWGDTFASRSAVLWNPVISDPTPGVGGTGFSFQITGTENIPIGVEATEDLLAGTWMLLETNALIGGQIDFQDDDGVNFGNRVYRIAAP